MSTYHQIAVMKMVHLSIGFRSTSQTSRADRSKNRMKNRHLYSCNKTKPRKVRGRHQLSSMVVRRWTFFVCGFTIQNCMWICHTKLVCGFPIQIPAVSGRSFCSAPWHCNTARYIYCRICGRRAFCGACWCSGQYVHA